MKMVSTCNYKNIIKTPHVTRNFLYIVDVTPPSITCSPSITKRVTNYGTDGGAKITWNPPKAIDNSGVPPTVFQSSSQQDPGSVFSFGKHNISYTAIDGAGNKATCQLMIYVGMFVHRGLLLCL